MEYYKPYQEKLDPIHKSGILEFDNDKYYVDGEEVENNRAINGDQVYISKSEVVGIKERNQNLIVGILYLNNNIKYGFNKKMVPYYKFSAISVKYPDFIVPSKLKNKEKYYCVIKINKWETNNKNPIGQVEQIIGPIGNLNYEIEMLLYRTNIYPRKKFIEYENLPRISDKAEYNTISIDPFGCKDIDDAIHFNQYFDYYEVGIHIANVARYIKTININLYSSIYLEDHQINMLSNEHTFNLCSLGNQEKKRALSLILKYNKKYKIISYKFKECIINNTAMAYEQADSIIKNTETFSKEELMLKDLYNFAIKSSEDHKLSSTSMIEHFMLLYNSLAADVLYKYNQNTILRTHKINGDLKTEESILQKYLNKTSQNAALYQINPIETSHQSLKLKYYTHATSPIRRYVDIINQINLIKYLSSEEIIIETEIDKINDFSKKLRKFNNLYTKLKYIFNIDEPKICNAYIVAIKNNRVNIYIPELEIEHKFIIISNKLLESNEVISSEKNILINQLEFKLYQKIKIKLTSLKHEDIFEKKLHIEIVEPRIKLV
jgi:exoribonuclease R